MIANSIRLSAGVLLLLALGGARADATLDRLLVSQCAQCHGTDGNRAAGFENLAGKDYRDVYDDLVDRLFENDPDERDLMTHQAQGYTLEDLDRIARYLSTVPR